MSLILKLLFVNLLKEKIICSRISHILDKLHLIKKRLNNCGNIALIISTRGLTDYNGKVDL